MCLFTDMGVCARGVILKGKNKQNKHTKKKKKKKKKLNINVNYKLHPSIKAE